MSTGLQHGLRDPRGGVTVVRGGPCWIAGVLVLGWIAVAHRYGFHRDELYFIEGGRHLAAGQPDNPILVPWLATTWHDLVGGHLTAFRIVPALVGGATVLIAAQTAKALGGDRRQQQLAALFMGLSAFPLGIGHLFSTATFDLLLTSAAVLAVIRAVSRPEGYRRWVVVGVLVGLALEVKLIAVLVIGCAVIAVILVGPCQVRGVRLLRYRGFWVAVALALVLAGPNLVWQAVNGWPMLEVAADIAAGGSATSSARVVTVPLMLLMVGPVLGPLMIFGFVSTWRTAALRPHRWLSVAFGLLLVLVLATGGKPYYLAGYFAAGLALATRPFLQFVRRSRAKQVLAVAVLVATWVPTVVFALPLAPIGSLAFRVAVVVNPDTAETVGWDQVIDQTIAALRDEPGIDPASTVVITANYGEAGALTRARRLGVGSSEDTGDGSPADPQVLPTLPAVYSGHNAFWSRGPPPEADTVILVGDFAPEIVTVFVRCQIHSRVQSPPGVDNEENGAPIRICRGPVSTLAAAWPQFRRYG